MATTAPTGNSLPRTWRAPRVIDSTWLRWTITIAVLGYLVLAVGSIDASWTPVTESFFTGHGYGYGWFATELAGQQVRYAWGHGGQFLFVVPSAGLTVAMTSDTEDYRRGDGYVEQLHALMAEAIIPAAMSGQSAIR